jgi:hypothetical protein
VPRGVHSKTLSAALSHASEHHTWFERIDPRSPNWLILKENSVRSGNLQTRSLKSALAKECASRIFLPFAVARFAARTTDHSQGIGTTFPTLGAGCQFRRRTIAQEQDKIFGAVL